MPSFTHANTRTLVIRGIRIGEHGKEKIHQKVKEQEARTGLGMKLNE